MSVSLASLPETWTRAGRDAARAVVRAALGYDAWLARNPDVNRNAITKPEIVQAAKDLGIVDKVAAAVWQEMRASGHIASDEEIAVAAGEPAAVDPAKDWPAGPAAIGMGAAAVDPAAVDAAIDRVLSPVRGFLSDGLVAGLADRIRPIAVEAMKPAKVVEKVVEVPAAPVAPAGVAPYAKIVGTSTMGKVFSLKGAQAKLPVSLWDAHDAPVPDPTYQVDIATISQVVTAAEHSELVWLAGPMGSGKGSLAREIAARTGRSYLRIGFHRATEIVDLQGQLVPVPGATHGNEMVWKDGAFVAAIRRPGTFVLLDEPTIAPAGTFAWFQTVLDERQVTLPTGEVVNFAPGVIVMLADNSAGYGDESGAYAGIQPANAALVDRAGRVVIVDYLPVAKEALALNKRTGLPFPACERLANFAAHVRKEAAKTGGEARAFSYRRLIAFAVATFRDRLAIDESVNACWLTRLPEQDRETLRTMVRTEFKADDYAREMAGETVEAASTTPLSQEAEQVGARDVFGRS